jgi:type I restriction enzyme R subunit
MNFEKLPEDRRVLSKFASLFRKFNSRLIAANLQGFSWSIHKISISELEFKALVLRYKELFNEHDGQHQQMDLPYEIDSTILETYSGAIDADYMNSKFEKYYKVKVLSPQDKETQDKALVELHKTFANLTQEEQKYAEIFLGDIQRGDVVVEKGKTFRDYITHYLIKGKNEQIEKFALQVGLNPTALHDYLDGVIEKLAFNANGKFDKLIESADLTIASKYFLELYPSLKKFQVKMKLYEEVKKFILSWD